jgi:hypothetical protein
LLGPTGKIVGSRVSPAVVTIGSRPFREEGAFSTGTYFPARTPKIPSAPYKVPLDIPAECRLDSSGELTSFRFRAFSRGMKEKLADFHARPDLERISPRVVTSRVRQPLK